MSVYIFDPAPNVPVYHAFGDTLGSWATGDARDVTICGRLLYDKHGDHAAPIPRRHADKFARPCHGCFEVEEAEPDA